MNRNDNFGLILRIILLLSVYEYFDFAVSWVAASTSGGRLICGPSLNLSGDFLIISVAFVWCFL